MVALQQFETKDAETHADQALKINPRLTVGPAAEGRRPAPRRRRRRPPASCWTGPRRSNPRDEPTLARLAACARVQNKPDEVKAIIAEVEKFNPKPGVFYHELASSLEDRKIYGDAEVYFKKSVELRDKLAGRARPGSACSTCGSARRTRRRTLLDQAFKGDTFNVRVSNSLKVLRHLDKYETIKTAHYDLRYDPKTDKLLAEFMAEYLETVHAQLAKDFGTSRQGRILIELFNNHEMFSGRTVGLPDLHTIGACTGKVVTIASPKGKGRRASRSTGAA